MIGALLIMLTRADALCLARAAMRFSLRCASADKDAMSELLMLMPLRYFDACYMPCRYYAMPPL